MNLPKIDKNIPLKATGTKAQQRIEFLRSLEVGDSFELPKSDKRFWDRFIYDDTSNMEFCSRKQGENSVRIWRLK